jgi:hypothetical protein
MTQEQTQPTTEQTTQDKDAIKAGMMAHYATHYAKIEAGRAAVLTLENAASDYAETIMKSHGPGPHKMVHNGDEYVVTFQRVSKRVRPHVLRWKDVK